MPSERRFRPLRYLPGYLAVGAVVLPFAAIYAVGTIRFSVPTWAGLALLPPALGMMHLAWQWAEDRRATPTPTGEEADDGHD